MPIKFPKSFQRRKSSGQALEEISNPPQTSFRVLERTPDSSKSFDGGHTARRTNEIRPLSEAGALDLQDGRMRPIISPYNRGSGGTQNSNSSGGLFDTSSSSARYSSSSTLPSTTSITGQDEPQPTPLKKTQTAPLTAPTRAAPATPSPSFLRAAGRTLSFGARRMTESAATSPANIDMAHHSMDFSDIPDVPDVNAPSRKRALTETSHASGSTATPPKLAESDLNLGLSISEDNDDWGNMFNKLNSHDKRKSVGGHNSKYVGSPVLASAADQLSKPPSSAPPPPPPVHIDRTRNVTPGPLTGTSYNSQEQLISASPVHEESGFRARPVHNRNSSSFLKFQHLAGQDSPSSDQQFLSPHESPTFNPRDSVRMSAPILDDEARAVLGYLSPGRKSPSYAPVPTSVPSPPLHMKSSLRRDSEVFLSQRQPLTLHDGENQDYTSIADSTSIMTTPRAHRAEPAFQEVSLDDDMSFREMARSAAQIESGEHTAPRATQPKGKKVMTPAEFEQYKEDKERYRDSSEQERTDDSDKSDPEDYDDDDEAERTAELTKQRRKQEAKLSVYRQQMMKVTGERNLPSLQPSPNGGSPGLSKRVSSTSLRDRPGGGSKSSAEDDDDDDDIPLGILAAHGFPSKDRPPSHLQRVSSQPNIRYTSETYPTPSIPPLPGSSNNLPVFARNLPKDPYYGASLVNAPVRETMGFSNGAGSVYGGSQHGGASSNIPPGGLVGIIAQEERAKALRRGTPGSRSFDATNQAAGLPLPPSMMPPSQVQMPMHPPQPVVSPDQQAQMQMNQQMTQMMQMQMQWMSQMMQMQGMQGSQMPQMPMMQQSMSMPQMPTLAQMQAAQPRQSTSGPGTPGGLLSVPNAGPRPASNGSQFGQIQQQSQHLAQNAMWQGSRPSLAQSQMLGNRTSTMPAQTNYAHSIAPSERSNIGQPSRYRPVSTMGDAQPANLSGRASTMGTNAYKAWEARPMSQSSLATSQTPTQAQPKPAATIRPVIPRIVDDEDEDYGWEEMRKKREGKKKIWREKKSEKGGETGLEGVFYPTDVN